MKAFLSYISVSGQEFQINPYANYFLAGRLNGYYADALFDNGADFGFGVSYGLGKGKHLEVSYTFAKSGAYIRDNANDSTHSTTNMSFGYIQAVYVQEINIQKMPQLRPFGMFTIGAAYLDTEDTSFITEWKFAASIGGGIKYFITDVVGFRIQARLLMPLFFENVSGSCGNYYGYSSGMNSFTSLAQGDVGGGLVLRFGSLRCRECRTPTPRCCKRDCLRRNNSETLY